MAFSRRGFWQRTLGALACAAVLGGVATGACAAPVTLNIVDVAGNLALTQKGFEAFRDKYPDLVSKITFTITPCLWASSTTARTSASTTSHAPPRAAP